jgi:hypothetical protein
MKRIAYDLLILLAVFLTPWWAVLILIVGGIFIFDKFLEAPITAIIFAGMYGIVDIDHPLGAGLYALSVGLIFLLLSFIKRFIVVYKD